MPISPLREVVSRQAGGIGRDSEELRQLQPALHAYVATCDDVVKTRPSRPPLRTYVRGPWGSLPRKRVEPMALAAGVPPRTRPEFRAIYGGDAPAVARRHREVVRPQHGHPEASAILEETRGPKQGDKTPGVQRQHGGAPGKPATCVGTVPRG